MNVCECVSSSKEWCFQTVSQPLNPSPFSPSRAPTTAIGHRGDSGGGDYQQLPRDGGHDAALFPVARAAGLAWTDCGRSRLSHRRLHVVLVCHGRSSRTRAGCVYYFSLLPFEVGLGEPWQFDCFNATCDTSYQEEAIGIYRLSLFDHTSPLSPPFWLSLLTSPAFYRRGGR